MVAKDHLSRRRGGGCALGSIGGGLGGRPAFECREQVLQPGEQVLALHLDRRADDFRIGRGERARRQHAGELPGVELGRLAGDSLAAPAQVADQVHPLVGQQIGLLDVVENVVVLPAAGLGASTTRCFAAGGAGRRAAPEHPAGSVLPEREIVLPQRHVGADDVGRQCHHPLGEVEKDASQSGRITPARRHEDRRVPAQPVVDDLLAALRHLAGHPRELGGVG